MSNTEKFTLMKSQMFFATPHHGLDRNTWRDFARFVLQHDAPVKGAMPTRTMVRQLEKNCDNLRDITEDFKPLYDSLAFVTFVEEEPMPGLKHVVCTCFTTSLLQYPRVFSILSSYAP